MSSRGARDRVGDQVGEGHPLARRLQLAAARVQDASPSACGSSSRSGSTATAPCSAPAPPRRPSSARRPPACSAPSAARPRRCRRCGRRRRRRAEHVGLDDAPAGPLPETFAGPRPRPPPRVPPPGRPSRRRAPARRWRRPLRRRRRLARAALSPAALGRRSSPSALPSPTAIRAITWPTVTVSPSSTRISLTVPLAGEGSSTSTLSVEISTIVSSSLMLADLDVPFEDRSLGDRLARGGGHDIDCLLSRGARRHLSFTLARRRPTDIAPLRAAHLSSQ